MLGQLKIMKQFCGRAINSAFRYHSLIPAPLIRGQKNVIRNSAYRLGSVLNFH